MNLRHEIVSSRNLKDLPTFRLFPYSCKHCVYWESTDDFDEKVSKKKAQLLKSDWFRNVSKEFGDCGVTAYLDDEPIGYAQYALPTFFPRVQQYGSGPPSERARFKSHPHFSTLGRADLHLIKYESLRILQLRAYG